MPTVICPWCRNDNILLRPNCPHCGEEIEKAEETEFQADDEAEEPLPADLLEEVPDSWKGAAVAVLVAFVLVAGGKVTFDHWPRHIFPGESSQPRPSITAEPWPPGETAAPSSPAEDPAIAQVEAIDGLLAAVTASHRKLPDTLGGCDSAAADLGPLKEVTEERRQQAEQAGFLQVDAIPEGDALKQALMEMTSASLQADEEYVTWAEQAQSSVTCTEASQDSSIVTANKTATSAKRRFADLWSSIASQHGGSAYTAGDF